MSVIVAILALCAAGYGAAAATLLPRAAYRLAVPPGTPPREHCPSGHRLEGPAHGWLGRARCPACAASGDPGAPRLPVPASVLEPSARFFVSVCASACAVLALSTGVRPELGAWLIAAPVVLLLASVDARTQRLPDVLTLPLAATTAVLLGLAALAPGSGGSWTGALLGGAVLTGAYWLLHLINRRGMGFGDVKLAGVIGLVLGWFSWGAVVVGAFAGFFLGAVVGVAVLAAGVGGRKTALPFGPFMVLGALAALWIADPVVDLLWRR
jgi:leader peptidase (prepilin peptidase) / N-methyltransferase